MPTETVQKKDLCKYVYVVLSEATKKAPRFLCLLKYLTYYPADFKQAEYYMDSSGK